MEENYDVENAQTSSFMVLSFYEHCWLCIKYHWLPFLKAFIVSFGVSWGVVESLSYLLKIDLSNICILIVCLAISFLLGIGNSIFGYINTAPSALENESKKIYKIAIYKKAFWEYKLASVMLNSRLEKIDQNLDGLLTGKAHVKVTKSLSIEDYSKWLKLRPINLLNMVDVAKTLLIFEMPNCLGGKETGELDLKNLVVIADQIQTLYKAAYDFEMEGKQIEIPDDFEFIHKIQAGWVVGIRDGIRQLLDILDEISQRTIKDLEPINATITFDEPPMIVEFDQELERLEKKFF